MVRKNNSISLEEAGVFVCVCVCGGGGGGGGGGAVFRCREHNTVTTKHIAQ